MEEIGIDWRSTKPVVMGGELSNLPNEVESCVLFRTSGSSGVEKWVALGRENLEWSARTVIEALEISSRDVLGLALPVHHVGGFGLVARSHFSGAALWRYPEKWSPETFTEWANGVTISSLVPTQVTDLVKAGCRAPGPMRSIVVGGGALDEDLLEKARALGWPLVLSYGMTETSSQVATGDGLPLLPGWEARVDEERLALKGDGLLRGYLIDGVFSDPKQDGWFLTQDRVLLKDRKITFLSRADRQVKILGELVDLDALEEKWRKQFDRMLVITTLPDARRGVSLWLFITESVAGVEEWNARLSGPERLSGWQFIEELPRSALGKIDRAKLQNVIFDKS